MTIGFATLPDAAWRAVERALGEQALYRAQLLAGELPAELEGLFAETGAPLFPKSVRELTMRCTCPDAAVPCKHIAATFYLLAERFDDDPFELLLWRGRSRADLLADLATGTEPGGATDAAPPAGAAPMPAPPAPTPAPLPKKTGTGTL